MCREVHMLFAECGHKLHSYTEYCDDAPEDGQDCGKMEEPLTQDDAGACFDCYSAKKELGQAKNEQLEEQQLRMAMQESEELARQAELVPPGFDEDELEQALEASMEPKKPLGYFMRKVRFTECEHELEEEATDVLWDPEDGTPQLLVTDVDGLCDLCAIEAIDAVYKSRAADAYGESSSGRRPPVVPVSDDEDDDDSDEGDVEPMAHWRRRAGRPLSPEPVDQDPASKGKTVMRPPPVEEEEDSGGASDEDAGDAPAQDTVAQATDPDDERIPSYEESQLGSVYGDQDEGQEEDDDNDNDEEIRLGGGRHPLLDRLERQG